MAKKFDRAAMKEQLKERGEQSYKSRNDKGRFRDYFNSSLCDELKVSRWNPSKGDHMIDVVPYFAGHNDPHVPKGQATYVLDLWVHQRIGPSDDSFVCPVQFNQECPICEERKRRSDANEDWETRIKPLQAKRRVTYNIIVRDNGKEEAKGIQLLEIAHWFMEKHLIKISKDPRGGMTAFWDADEGKLISFDRTGTGAENTGYDGHTLRERNKPITDENLESAFTIDELINKAAYQEIHDAFYSIADPQDDPENTTEHEETQEEETTPASAATPKKKETPTPKKKEEEEEPECPIGQKFGIEFDEWEQCDTCAIRDRCKGSDVPL